MARYAPTQQMAAVLLAIAGLASLADRVKAAGIDDIAGIELELEGLLDDGVPITEDLSQPLSAEGRALVWSAREILFKIEEGA